MGSEPRVVVVVIVVVTVVVVVVGCNSSSRSSISNPIVYGNRARMNRHSVFSLWDKCLQQGTANLYTSATEQ